MIYAEGSDIRMKNVLRALTLALVLCMLCTSGLAASKSKTTPTPPPQEIPLTVQQPPEQIQNLLNIAYNEWNTLAGKTLKKCNKYTEWRGKGVSFGWCGGFITWCMMEAGVPMQRLDAMRKEGEFEVEGVMHVEEASVGKLLRGYQVRFRSTNVPQPGFLLVYGQSYNKTIHIGLVYDVEDLGGGKYRITTIEGNMSNRVKMYVHDYDMNAEKQQKNLTVVPKAERTREESSWFTYKKQADNWYVNCFLMPWVPDGMTGQGADGSNFTQTDPYVILTPAPEV